MPAADESDLAPLDPAKAAVVIPAFNEASRIGATVQSTASLKGVDLIVVVDDGSTDGTTSVARAAGAVVVTIQRNQGKAAALEIGAAEVARQERRVGCAPRPLLFLDADLERSAAAAGPLLEPVLQREVDMTIATLPPQPGGGHGFVVRLAREGIREATGLTMSQPLSGQRALSRAAFETARPLAPGWGVEVALTIDVLRAGLRVREVPLELHHRVTGKDWRAQVHRGRQFWGVWRALRQRGVGPRVPVPR